MKFKVEEIYAGWWTTSTIEAKGEAEAKRRATMRAKHTGGVLRLYYCDKAIASKRNGRWCKLHQNPT